MGTMECRHASPRRPHPRRRGVGVEQRRRVEWREARRGRREGRHEASGGERPPAALLAREDDVEAEGDDEVGEGDEDE